MSVHANSLQSSFSAKMANWKAKLSTSRHARCQHHHLRQIYDSISHHALPLSPVVALNRADEPCLDPKSDEIRMKIAQKRPK